MKDKKIISEPKEVSTEFRKLITLKIYKSFLPISSKIEIDSVVPLESKDEREKGQHYT